MHILRHGSVHAHMTSTHLQSQKLHLWFTLFMSIGFSTKASYKFNLKGEKTHKIERGQLFPSKELLVIFLITGGHK